jgi:hypothetical protein
MRGGAGGATALPERRCRRDRNCWAKEGAGKTGIVGERLKRRCRTV